MTARAGCGPSSPRTAKKLRRHSFRLLTPRLGLRPMMESDWAKLLSWNEDPRVLEFWDSGNEEPWSLEKLQAVYRGISERAFMFIIEHRGEPIGECWVQEMNLPEILSRYSGLDLRRIDISIGEPQYWSQGLGGEAIGALVRFGFDVLRADALFACDVSEKNPRSRRAFARHGFAEVPPVPGQAATSDLRLRHHLVLWRSADLGDPLPEPAGNVITGL